MTGKRKKVVFVTTGAIALVVVAIVVALLINIQAFKPRIEAAASSALGMDVRIEGRLGFALVPGFGISMKGVSVRNRGGDVAVVEKMGIGLQLVPLLRREVRISRLVFVTPVFSVVRDKNGLFNFEKPDRTLPGKPFGVGEISISRGKLVYADERSGERIEATGLAATLRNLSYGGTAGAEPFRNISLTGDIACKKLTINKFTLANVAMKTAAEKGIIEVNPVSMELFGGTGKGSMHADMTMPSPRFRLIIVLKRFNIEELIKAFSSGDLPRKSMEGKVTATADLTATGRNAETVKRSLNGDLSLSGDDLLLSGVDIDALITKYERSQNFNLVDIGAYFLVGPFGPVLTKSYNFGSLYEESLGGNGVIRKLVSIWKVKNGIAEAADVALVSRKYRLAMKGGLDFVNSRFVGVTIAVLDKRGCAEYSQKVQGPFRKPQIGKISVLQSLSGSVSNALGDAWKFIRGGTCTEFYSGTVAQPEG